MARISVLAGRGLTLRCPHCGASFMNGIRILPSCRQCGLRLDRGEEGHFLGSMTVNMVTSEVVVLAFIVWSVLRSLPEMPPRSHFVAAMTAAVLLPILLYPISKTVWLAFDLVFRPQRPSDFEKRP